MMSSVRESRPASCPVSTRCLTWTKKKTQIISVSHTLECAGVYLCWCNQQLVDVNVSSCWIHSEQTKVLLEVLRSRLRKKAVQTLPGGESETADM